MSQYWLVRDTIKGCYYVQKSICVQAPYRENVPVAAIPIFIKTRHPKCQYRTFIASKTLLPVWRLYLCKLWKTHHTLSQTRLYRQPIVENPVEKQVVFPQVVRI